MISFTSEQRYYIYPGPMDMRKDIDGLAGVVRNDMQLDPTRRNGVFIFLSKKRNIMKILARGLDRFELLKIRLDKDKFLEPIYDEESQSVRLTWSDFVTITESVSVSKLRVKNVI
jgi:hypothetical protein